MPVISVILPVYNGERTIRETIESVLNQTFSGFELIVVNDGSKDSTLEILAQIEDPRLQVYSYPNAGVAASRNRGIARAVGEYLAFIDADDLWMPGKLKAQLKTLQRNPRAAVAYSWADCMDEAGRWVRSGKRTAANGDVYAMLLLDNFLMCGSTPMIRRQALDQVGAFDESISPVADWDMWLRLAAHYHFVCVPVVQAMYRVSADSMSFDLARVEPACLTLCERAFARSPAHLQHVKKRGRANIYKYLTGQALMGHPGRRRGLKATGLLWNAVRNDPSLLGTWAFVQVLCAAVAMILLPPDWTGVLFSRYTRSFDANSWRGKPEAPAQLPVAE